MLPSTFAPIRQTYLLAPFWSNIDLRRGGSVKYEIYMGSDQSAVAQLEYISNFIEQREGVPFSGCWMLIVTWLDTRPFFLFDSSIEVSYFFRASTSVHARLYISST